MHWFTGALVHWFTGSLGALVHWFTGALVNQCTNAPVQWLTGALVHWCTGSSVHWFTGALVHRFTGAPVHLVLLMTQFSFHLVKCALTNWLAVLQHIACVLSTFDGNSAFLQHRPPSLKALCLSYTWHYLGYCDTGAAHFQRCMDHGSRHLAIAITVKTT